MKMTFKEFLLAEEDPGAIDTKLQQMKTQQSQEIIKKSKADQLSDTNINRFQKQINIMTQQKADADKKKADAEAAAGKTKNQPEQTPSGTDTTQQVAPSARIGFGTSFSGQ